MKTNILKLTALCMLCTLFSWSCDTKNIEDDQQLSELISTNLLKNELVSIDPALLIGEWNCEKFAYTADGNTISDVVTISKGSLTIPYAPTPIEHNAEDRWNLKHSNGNWFICSLTKNLIKLELRGSTFMLSPPEEEEIVNALMNAYSFAIKGNKLIIYFTGVKNKNLLILEKR